MQLATIQKLPFRSAPSWRRRSKRINFVSELIADIDGVDIHFIHEIEAPRTPCDHSSRAASPGSMIER